MNKFIVLCCAASLCLGVPLPQEGFGDATPEEIAEIRAGTFGEMFDENPKYAFDFKVADDVEQTYIAQQETRDSDIVTGSYSYVDPYGSLITVNYEAGPMGYTETREVQENFVQIRERPASSFSSSNSGSSSLSSSSSGSSSGSSFGSSSSSNSFSSGSSSLSDLSASFDSNSFSSGSSSLSSGQQSSSSSSFSQDDLISSVVSQIQPLVSGAVNSAISSSSSNRGSSSSSISSSSRPVTTTTITSSRPVATSTALSNQDLVSSVISQIQPLVSGAVSSAISNSGSGRTVARVRVPVAAVRLPVVPPPATAVLAPAPPPRPVQPAARTAASLGDFFGDGNFNVRINTPDFNIEY